jgi:hypothetical protein
MLEAIDNGEKFFVVGIVVDLGWRELSGVEGYRVEKFSARFVRMPLGEYATKCKVGGISFDDALPIWVEVFEDRCGGEFSFELGEGSFDFGVGAPTLGVQFRRLSERVADAAEVLDEAPVESGES